jgi:hypothetical protein
VADARCGGVVGLLVDDDVLLLRVVVVVILIHGKVLDRVGLPRLVHAEEGRSAADGVLLAEEVVLELFALDALRVPPPLLALVDHHIAPVPLRRAIVYDDPAWPL